MRHRRLKGFNSCLPAKHDYSLFLICFISTLNHSYWGKNECSNIKPYKYFATNLANMSNFHPLEVVSRYRGSETQLQVGENIIFIM